MNMLVHDAEKQISGYITFFSSFEALLLTSFVLLAYLQEEKYLCKKMSFKLKGKMSLKMWLI